MTKDTGLIISLKDGIAEIVGCEGSAAGELLLSEKNYGIVLNVKNNLLNVVFLTENNLSSGCSVKRTRILPSLNFSLVSYLGEIITPLGEFLTTTNTTSLLNRLTSNILSTNLLIEVKAPGILSRQSVYEPVSTGLKIIDGLIPVGKGQRELIIGDRQTGKTAVAIDTILNQANNIMYK